MNKTISKGGFKWIQDVFNENMRSNNIVLKEKGTIAVRTAENNKSH